MDERKVGVIGPETVMAMDGLSILRAMRDGDLPHAEITAVADFRLVEVEDGAVTFEGRPAAAFLNPLGAVHGGWITTLLDSAMGCAIHTRLPAGMAYTTVELKINFVRPVLPQTGPVRAVGKVIHTSRRFGTSEAQLLDQAGKLLAFGNCTCFVFPADERSAKA